MLVSIFIVHNFFYRQNYDPKDEDDPNEFFWEIGQKNMYDRLFVQLYSVMGLYHHMGVATVVQICYLLHLDVIVVANQKQHYRSIIYLVHHSRKNQDSMLA